MSSTTRYLKTKPPNIAHVSYLSENQKNMMPVLLPTDAVTLAFYPTLKIYFEPKRVYSCKDKCYELNILKGLCR